jgi:hypothetical protein
MPQVSQHRPIGRPATHCGSVRFYRPAVAGESGTIRIGTQVPTALQTNTYIAGIYNNSSVTGGLPVVIDSSPGL